MVHRSIYIFKSQIKRKSLINYMCMTRSEYYDILYIVLTLVINCYGST